MKSPVVTQRKIIVRNADGTTKVIVQNIIAPSQTANKPAVESTTTTQPTRQKLGIIRGLDGKITSVTGLKPGQQLIESPQGLRIVTTSTPNRNAEQKYIMKSDNLPKVVSKVSNISQDSDGQPKGSVVVRQHVRGAPANVIVKSVQSNKPTSSSAGQRVVLNSGQIVSSSPQPMQVGNTTPTVQKIITSKRQLLANNPPKTVVRTSNLQQLLNQGTTQKILQFNQTNTPNKIIIASTANNHTTNQNSTTATAQHTIVAAPAAQQVQYNCIFHFDERFSQPDRY